MARTQETLTTKYELAGYDTSSATVAWDTVSLGDTYDRVVIYSDDATLPFYVSATSNASDAVRIPAGGIYDLEGEISTILWKMRSGSALLTVNKYKRKRY